MSVAQNQRQVFLRLLAALRPHWHRDAALPSRVQALLTGNRAFGSRDRKLYRELIYTTLRYLPWIEPLLDAQTDEAVRRVAWLAAETPATKAFRAALAIGEPPTGDKAELLPAWFHGHCPEIFSGAEMDAQLRRAPLWLRLQTNEPRPVLDEFDRLQWPWHQSEILSPAVALEGDADVTKTEAWREGFVEIQDLGSQLILASVGVMPGERWLDACAGAGGKTLQLARLVGATGHVTAHDIRPAALAELRARADRARLKNISITDTPKGEFAGVLVDAPCSGSGTWRRAPHLKWTATPAQIDAMAERQGELLAAFCNRVQPGGRLVYATCSLSRHENESVVNRFLDTHPDFEPAPFARTFGFPLRGSGFTILPAQHDTDGFFVASLRRK